MTGTRQLFARLQAPFSNLAHTSSMASWLQRIICFAWLALATLSPLQAQDSEDDSTRDSTGVEESDEAYRRRMELEDARQRDLGYTLPPQTYAQKQEKLDKLPEESRDNIRDQLVDIIVENGDWEPGDALKDYPYEPTAAARANPELMQQEQEAWDEQIEKYHKREAAAFGTYLGPTPGPGNPTGQEGGGEQGDRPEGEQAGSGQRGEDADQQARDDGQQKAASQAGTYDPYESNRSRSDDAVSTAGVQQSALDFLKGLQGAGQAPAASTAASGQTGGIPESEASSKAAANPQAAAERSQQNADAPSTAESGQQSADAEMVTAAEQPKAEPQTAADSNQQSADSADQEKQQESRDRPVEIDLTTPGVIPIKDLDKLQGADVPIEKEE